MKKFNLWQHWKFLPIGNKFGSLMTSIVFILITLNFFGVIK